MNHLIARIRVRGNNKYRKLLSGDQVLFNWPENVEAIEYSPTLILEEGQWFTISDFSKRSYKNELIERKWDSTLYSSDLIDVDQLEYICAYQDDDVYYFQKVYKNCIIRNKIIITLGDLVKAEEPRNRLTINQYPDAMYVKSRDILYFRKLEPIVTIFKGIGELYKEATSDEVYDFLNQSFIKVSSGFSDKGVGKLNRHRITWAKEVLDSLDDKKRKDLFNYTNEYYPDLSYEDGAFKIGSDDDLKYLLYGIGQRFYTTSVTKEKRVANSISPI